MTADTTEPDGPGWRLLRRAVDIRRPELAALGWAWLYVFALFLAYYVLRPIRDELGVAGGVRNLPWLFTGTLVAMLAVNPLFGWLVKRWPRETFIAIAYRFFMLNLLVFMLLLMAASDAQHVWIGRAFFIWVSVFNLFVVSVFWSLMVDVFDQAQGKRLFGFIAAGATTGGIAGSALTSGLVAHVGQEWLLVASIALLEVAVFAVRRLSRTGTGTGTEASGAVADPRMPPPPTAQPLGGSAFAGLTHTFRSPYLFGIAVFILLYAISSTVLYFQQASIAATHFPDRTARTAFFANIDLWVNVLTLGFQLFLTGRLTRWLGVGVMLATLPLLSVFGFAALAAWPGIAVFVVVQVGRRVANFALARPTREVLFTTVPREDRYKAKNFIDTVVYRGGDQVAAWTYAGLLALGLTVPGIALATVPMCVAWVALALWLGRRQARDAAAEGPCADSRR